FLAGFLPQPLQITYLISLGSTVCWRLPAAPHACYRSDRSQLTISLTLEKIKCPIGHASEGVHIQCDHLAFDLEVQRPIDIPAPSANYNRIHTAHCTHQF